MTIVHSWDVTVFAAGDRQLTHDELAEFTVALASVGGTPVGDGQHGYGCRIRIAAGTRDDAATIATDLVAAAAQRAALPGWPVTRTDVLGEHEQPTDAVWPAPAAPTEFDDDGTPED